MSVIQLTAGPASNDREHLPLVAASATDSRQVTVSLINELVIVDGGPPGSADG